MQIVESNLKQVTSKFSVQKQQFYAQFQIILKKLSIAMFSGHVGEHLRTNFGKKIQ